MAFLLRIMLVLAAATAIWRISLHLSGLYFGETAGIAGPLAFGAIVSALTIAFIWLMTRARPRATASARSGSIRKGLQDMMRGALWFLVPAGLAVSVAVATGSIAFALPEGIITAALQLALVLIVVLLSEALPEELLFRGYLYDALSGRTRAWATVLVQAGMFLLFAFLIGAIGSMLDASFLLTFAVILGMLRAAYGSVWVPVGFHLACMTCQQLFTRPDTAFAASQPELLQIVLLGVIPFSIAAAFLFGRVSRSASAVSRDK